MEFPLGHVVVHQGDEASVVGRFQEVHEFVNQDVLEALWGLLGQLGVEADRVGRGVAAPPFSLHPTDEEALHLDSQSRLPSRQQWPHSPSNLLSIPRLDKSPPLVHTGSGSNP